MSKGPCLAEALVPLSDRISALTGPDNAIDVLYEIATFQPDGHWKTCRANAAGTKVVYTDKEGDSITFRAGDWTLTPESRAEAIAVLKAQGL